MMSAEGDEDLGKGSCKRQRENDDIIIGKRTRLRCKNAAAQLRTQTVDLKISQKQSQSNATSSAPSQKKVNRHTTESASAEMTYKVPPAMETTLVPSGIAIIGDEVFLSRVDYPTIMIYMYTTVATLRFCRLFGLRQRGLKSVYDMVACPRNKCLYIMDDIEPREILRVDTNGEILLKWSTGCSFGSLSATRESNLLLTDKVEGKLKEFSAEGKLVLEVVLPEDIRQNTPSHAVKLTSGHFVVCHGAQADPLHRVCLVDIKGILLKTYVGSPNAPKLNFPMYLAVDSDESILVADTDNSRVLLLNSNLEVTREIMTAREGLRRPWISLDELHGRLYVVGERWSELRLPGCVVFAFDLRKKPQTS